MDGIIAGTVSITVLSGQFLTDKKIGVYVEVDMYGLPADTVRKRFRTKIVRDNSINPVFDEEPFVFKKVVLPELASVRITAYEESGRFIGHRVLPVIGLCPGYRHLTLRNEMGQPLLLPTLFLSIVVKDFVPDQFSDFAEALANPIKYQSELEKRSVQLAVFTEDPELQPGGIEEDVLMADGTRSSTLQRRGQSRGLDEDSANSSAYASNVASANMAGSGTHQQAATAASGNNNNSNSSHNYNNTSNNSANNSQLMGSTVLGSGGSGSVAVPSLAASQSPQASASAAAAAAASASNTIDVQQHPVAAVANVQNPKTAEAIEADAIVADSLESILDHKVIREKRLEMEKKLESLRKKHDKEKVRICAASSRSGGESSEKKSKFNVGNKLVKRLSSKNM